MSASELLAQSRETIWPHLEALGCWRNSSVSRDDDLDRDSLPLDFYHPELRVSIAIGGGVDERLDYAIERQGIRRWHFAAGWARENPESLATYIAEKFRTLRFSEENCARMDRENQHFGDSGRTTI